MTTTEIDTTDAETATAIINARELRRRANDGWLIRPPIHPSAFAHARMEPVGLGSTHSVPTKELEVMRNWLTSIVEAGGERRDLRKAWEVWQPITPRGKGVLSDHYEALCRKIDARELDLANRLGEEGRTRRNLELAHARVRELEHEERKANAALNNLRAELARRQAELAECERAHKHGRP